MLSLRPLSQMARWPCRTIATALHHPNTPDVQMTDKPVALKGALEMFQKQGTRLYAKLLIHNVPFTVTRTDLIVTHRLKNVQVGDLLRLHEIREIGSSDYKLCGLPLLPKGCVEVKASVLEHTHGERRRARMRKQRKGRRALRTIKPRITLLRVQDICVNPEAVSSLANS